MRNEFLESNEELHNNLLQWTASGAARSSPCSLLHLSAALCVCRLSHNMETEYHPFLCDSSGKHGPIAAFKSSMPFPYVAVGQRFDDHGWDRLRGVGVIASEEKPIRYVVHSSKTVVRQEAGRLLIQVGFNLEPFEGDRSPAFGDTEPTLTWSEALEQIDT
jgi:hypothetical protein